MLRLIRILAFLGLAMTATEKASAATLHEGWQATAGVRLFFREGGDPRAPTIVFLHGYPLSSAMYTQVMEELLDRQQGKVHVIAVDYPGFGYSDAPDRRTWPYTFDHVAQTVSAFLQARGIRRYSLYMQDYGVPVGFRLIAADPSSIEAIIVQNGVIHLDGFPLAQDAHSELRRHWAHRSAAVDQRRIAYAQSLPIPHAGWVDEEGIGADAALLMAESTQRPGIVQARNDLWFDYGNNLGHYPAWQAVLRSMKVPVLVMWGSHDDFFTVPGAMAYRRDAPQAEVHVLDAGHFATLQVPDEIARLMSTFLDRHADAFGRMP